MLETYNLEKTKWVIGGIGLISLGGLLECFEITIPIVGYMGYALELVGIIIELLGLKDLAKYNSRFERAYKADLKLVLLSLATITVTLIVVFTTIYFAENLEWISPDFLILAVMIGLGLIACSAIYLSIVYIYNLVMGISDLFGAIGEDGLKKKVENFWYRLVTIVATAVCLGLFFTIIFVEMANLIIVVCAMVIYAVEVRMLMYLYKMYKLAQGKPIEKRPEENVVVEAINQEVVTTE